MSGCLKQAAPNPQPAKKPTSESTTDHSNTPATPIPMPDAKVEPPQSGNPAFDKVAAQLDPGGVIYVFWSADKILGQIDKKLAAARDEARNEDGLTAEERQKLTNELDLAGRLIDSSGLEGIKAFGFSSKQEDSGFFLNKSFVYVPDRSGFVWETLAKPPHDFQILDSIPLNTEAFAFYDVDFGALWRSLLKAFSESKIEGAADRIQSFQNQVQGLLGMSPDDLAASLGDQVGFVFTLDPNSPVQIPVRTPNNHIEIPEPAAALVWTVKNDKLFDRLDAWFSLSPQVQKIDEPDLKMRLLPGRPPAPYVNMAIARSGDYLLIATSDKLVRSIVGTREGKSVGVKSSIEFQQLAAGLPTRGNNVTYSTRTFQKTVLLIRDFYQMARGSSNFSSNAIENMFSRLAANTSQYSVSITKEDGIQTVGRSTKDINESFGDLVVLPAYFIAGNLIDKMKKNRDVDKIEKIKANLKEIESAKERAIAENGVQKGQMVSRQDIEPFLADWPSPVVGETYEIGTAGQPPYATAPVDLQGYPVGKHIEP
jgi:hypothetical protein